MAGLDPSSSDYGAFAITAPGLGMVWPRTAAVVDRQSAHATTMTYDGQAFINRRARIVGAFSLLEGFQGSVHRGHIRVVAHLDPSHRTGFLELWIGGKHTHLQFAPAPSDADEVMQSVVSALSTGDFGALYDLADTGFRHGLSRDEFVSRFTAAMGNDSVVRVRRTGPVSYSTTLTGVDYASAPANATVIQSGQRRVLRERLVLIREDGEWRFDTTRPLDDNLP